MTEEKLNNIYYDPKDSASFSTEEKLYKAAIIQDPSITRSQVKDYLLNQFTHTLHKPARKKFQRNRIVVSGPEEQMQADLVDMQMFSNENNGFKYILTAIDVFSKKAFAVLLKDKSANNIKIAFEEILKKTSPQKIQTDRGTEFKNNIVESFFAKHNIKLFYTNDEEIKCAVVERFNRTLKGKMFKYFTAAGKRRYIDVLPSLLAAYNNTYHSSIKMTPNEVTRENQATVFENLYGVNTRRDIFRQPKEKAVYSVGDTVRIRYQLPLMSKGYYPNYTDQRFTITRIIKGWPRTTYAIKDWKGEEVKGKFYKEEFTPVASDAPYRVDKILRKNKRTGKVLVQWLNYPAEAASWEPEAALKLPL